MRAGGRQGEREGEKRSSRKDDDGGIGGGGGGGVASEGTLSVILYTLNVILYTWQVKVRYHGPRQLLLWHLIEERQRWQLA